MGNTFEIGTLYTVNPVSVSLMPNIPIVFSAFSEAVTADAGGYTTITSEWVANHLVRGTNLMAEVFTADVLSTLSKSDYDTNEYAPNTNVATNARFLIMKNSSGYPRLRMTFVVDGTTKYLETISASGMPTEWYLVLSRKEESDRLYMWSCYLLGDKWYSSGSGGVNTVMDTADLDGFPYAVTAVSTEPEPTYDRTAFLSGMAMGLCGKGNPTFEGSGKYLYNGVELPELPTTDLQYAVLTHHEAYHYEGYGQVIDEPERYRLSILAEPFYAETSTNGTTYIRSHPSAKYQRWECNAPDFSRWELKSEGGWWVISYDDVLWTNHNVFFGELADTVEENIIYTDELYMAKSPDPVPVVDTFTKGYKTGAALRRKRALPVAYLYNGVRLPNIYSLYTPELQKTHPFVWVSTESKWHFIHLSTQMPCVNADGKLFFPNGAEVRNYDIGVDWQEGDDFGWSINQTYEAGGVFVSAKWTFWANADILNEDGSVYIYASEPVPVYE